MVNLLIFFLSINLFNVGQQEQFLKAQLSLMYRRSGQTALNYRTLSSGDTVHYYKRGFNPYFRVYKFKFNNDSLAVGQMTVESYRGNSLMKKTNLRAPRVKHNILYVDTHVEEEESLVKLTVHGFDSVANKNEDFILFIIPDKNWE